MPPRVPGLQGLGTFSLFLRPAAAKPTASPPLLPRTQTASMSQREKKQLMKQDPYRWAQMQQRKAAHLQRREVIEADRAARAGDPVRGVVTPFVESFDSAGQAPLSTPPLDELGQPTEEPHPLPTSPHVLNNLVRRDELDAALENAYALSRPLPTLATETDPELQQAREAEHDRQHATAKEAVERILHLAKGSAKDRRHANIRRCVETFGRHNTDISLGPQPLSRGQEPQEQPGRAGADTGSSEVQIAILTSKIRALANALEGLHGHRDKVGKRDLRLLCHRRQRLMHYMYRKEKGGTRWKHLIETLGLSEATWKDQITL